MKNNFNSTILKSKRKNRKVANEDLALQNIVELPEEEDDDYSGVIIKVRPNNYDDENGQLRPISVF